MLRSSLYTAGALLACTSAFAQQDASSLIRPITAPVREASVRVDPQTGVTVRIPNSVGDSAKEIVYSNTCPSTYYAGQTNTGGSQIMAFGDEGRLPSTTSPAMGSCLAGCADDYDITQFQIAYCTDTGLNPTNIVHFWQTNTTSSCNDAAFIGGQVPPILATVASVTITGLPRSAASGTLACYGVNVNLGTPGFTLNGAASGAAGRFKWSTQFPGSTGNDGPILASNLFFGTPCNPCVGTIWESPSQTTNPGSGLDSQDQFFIEDWGGTLATGCYFFGGPGNPYSSFHLQLFANKPCTPDLDTPFCNASDGAHAFCPCSDTATAPNPDGGCQIAQLNGGVIADTAMQDTVGTTATILGTGFPPASSPTAIVIRANNQEATPVVFGDGLRCVGVVQLVRLAATTASSGTSTHVFGHNPAFPPANFFYQLWFRNTPATGPCAAASTTNFNLSNGVKLFWP
jgi:hypothetical protein